MSTTSIAAVAAAPILDTAALAARWHTSPGYIRRLNSASPGRLPARILVNGDRLLWRIEDVQAFEQRAVVAATPAPVSAPAPKPGKPGRKSVAAKAREAELAAGAAA